MNFFHAKRSSKRAVHTNPMLLTSIIHRTMGYLDMTELLACRQVNKLWREEVTKELQSRECVTTIVPDMPALEAFAKIAVEHKKTFPVEFMFAGIQLGPNINMSERHTQEIIEMFAFYLTHLQLEVSMGSLEWRLLLFDQFTNLKELHFHGSAPFQPILVPPIPDTGSCSGSPLPSTSKAYHQGRSKELLFLTRLVFRLTNRKSEEIFVKRFLKDLFQMTPNLEYLEWVRLERFGNEFQKTMFDCLMMKAKITGPGRLGTIKCPSLNCGVKELRDITEREFPLKEIHVQISSDISAQFLEHFLEAHGSTLENIKFEFSPGSPLNITVTSPISALVHLRELTLTDYRRSIGFVCYLPCLKKLTLKRTNIKRALLSIGWAYENKDQKELSRSLSELYVYNDYLSRDQGNCTREIVLKLAHCFPQLKAIRLEGLDDSSLRHLFKSFSSLEVLSAPSGTYTDEAFRSFTSKDHSSGNGRRSPIRCSLSAFDASHLKHLRTLELESIGLTDKFILQGIINWRSLRNLSVKYCKISYTALSRLLMELDLHNLRLHHCTICTEGAIGFSEDPLEMTQDDDMLFMSYRMIHKWRFDSFRLLLQTSNPTLYNLDK